MAREVVAFLTREATQGGLFVDATLGGGGHSEALLLVRPDIEVLGIDQDAEALEAARERLQVFGSRFEARQASFRKISSELGSRQAQGVLMDLGVSSRQLDSAERGFSFQKEGPLDMRMDKRQSLT